VGDALRKISILARQDLSQSQRAVQACQALAELMVRQAGDPSIVEWTEKQRTLILLAVANEDELYRWEDELRARGIPCEHFKEPDMGDQVTALAVHPEVDGELFRKLSLL
jgi:peptidyl-tRNA hydrolase